MDPKSQDVGLATQALGASGVASSGSPDDLLMWKPESITNHNLEILRKELNEKYENINLENYYDLHRYAISNFLS